MTLYLCMKLLCKVINIPSYMLTKKVFVYVFPMRSKAEAGDSLGNVVKDIGIMNEIHFDNAMEQVGKNIESTINFRKYNIHVYSTDPYLPWQNKAKNQIQIIKGISHMRASRSWFPKILWDFLLVWESEIYSHTSGADGQTGMRILTGDTPDISDWADF